MDRQPDIFNDYLDSLGVAHTRAYSADRFASMPFATLFGLSKLLGEYGVETAAFRVSDKSADLDKIAVPFIAPMNDGLVIVTEVTGDSIGYLSQGVAEKVSRGDWVESWQGVALCGAASESSCEPDYKAHRRLEMLKRLRDIGLRAGLVMLFLYLFISNGLWSRVSLWFVTAFDIAGLYFTWLLVRKSLGYKDRHADAVCGVLQKGGCDEILSMDASKLFGLFGWAEIGFTYFSVSLLALLMFPQSVGWLAVCNLCCLPFTAWSIWYQKFRAKVWCTLCVSVQCTLWLLFFCYLGGGWIELGWPLGIGFFVLGATYVTVLLILNRILPKFEKDEQE